FEKLAASQHAPDLAGASSDLIELRIAQVAAGGVFIDVAVAAQELYRIERESGRILGGVQNGAGSVFPRHLAAIAGLRHRIDIRLRRVHGDIHVRELGLHQLKLADGFAELLALMHVGHHAVHAGLHDAERPGREHHALVIEAGHQYAHALALAPEDIVPRHLAVNEDKLAGIGAAHAEFV